MERLFSTSSLLKYYNGWVLIVPIVRPTTSLYSDLHGGSQTVGPHANAWKCETDIIWAWIITDLSKKKFRWYSRSLGGYETNDGTRFKRQHTKETLLWNRSRGCSDALKIKEERRHKAIAFTHNKSLSDLWLSGKKGNSLWF